MEAQEVQSDAGFQIFLEDLKKRTENESSEISKLELRLRSISEHLQETGVIKNKNLFKEIFQIITLSSQVVLFSNAQEDILNILEVATKNGVEEDLIRDTFKKIKLEVDNLKHLELMSYSTLINLSSIKIRGKEDFSEDEWNLISNNIIHCEQVYLYDSILPIYCQPKLMESTSAVADKRDEMKLKKLIFCNMPISSKEAMTVANLACFTEKVEFNDVRISQTCISHICEHLMKQKQQRLKEIEFRKCPLMHPDMKRKMEENGMKIQEYRQKYIFLLYERENRDLVLSINEKLQNDEYSVVIDDNFEEFAKQHSHPLVVLVFVQHKVSDELEKKIFAQRNQFAIGFVKLESDFELSHALSFLFENSPFIDFTKIGNHEERIIELQRMVLAVIETFPQYRHKLFEMEREFHEMAETFPGVRHKFFEMGRELREMAETFPGAPYKLYRMEMELDEISETEMELREMVEMGRRLREVAETFPKSRPKSLGSTTNVEELVGDIQVKSTKESIGLF